MGPAESGLTAYLSSRHPADPVVGHLLIGTSPACVPLDAVTLQAFGCAPPLCAAPCRPPSATWAPHASRRSAWPSATQVGAHATGRVTRALPVCHGFPTSGTRLPGFTGVGSQVLTANCPAICRFDRRHNARRGPAPNTPRFSCVPLAADPKLTYWTKEETPFLSLPPPAMNLTAWRDPFVIGRPDPANGCGHW